MLNSTVKLTKGYQFKGKVFGKLNDVMGSKKADSMVSIANELPSMRSTKKKFDFFRKKKKIELFKSILFPNSSVNFKAEHWICANICDFIDEMYIFYLSCKEDYILKCDLVSEGFGFPDGMEFQWQGQETNGSEYISYVFEWFLDIINDPKIFVDGQDETLDFPSNFKVIVSKMFTRLLRLYGMIVNVERSFFKKHKKIYNELEQKLKRFIFFSIYWDVIDFTGQDTKPLQGFITKQTKNYKKQYKHWESSTPTNDLTFAETNRTEFIEKYITSRNYRATPTHLPPVDF